MIQDADKLQNEFKALCKTNGVRGSFAYFIDHDHRAMFSFNDINDSELMHAAASIAVHIAKRLDLDPAVVIDALKDGLPILMAEDK